MLQNNRFGTRYMFYRIRIAQPKINICVRCGRIYFVNFKKLYIFSNFEHYIVICMCSVWFHFAFAIRHSPLHVKKEHIYFNVCIRAVVVHC